MTAMITERQANHILKLIEERHITAEAQHYIRTNVQMGLVSRQRASEWITKLHAIRYRPEPVTVHVQATITTSMGEPCDWSYA